MKATPVEKRPTQFIISVDVESRTKGNPDADIWGTLPNGEGQYGIGKIMDILESHHARGTFFLNVYEMATHGEETLKEVAQAICERGHELQLHTHPRAMYSVYGMAGASLPDQIDMLRTGADLLKRWTGKSATAHRAGAFLANADTLRAVESIGFSADCSLSPGSRNPSRLVKTLGSSNWVRRVQNIWVIPVTYYIQLDLGWWRSRRILDIEGSSLPEIKRVVRWAIRHRLPTVCILMHSFSLCRPGRPKTRVIRRMNKLLQWLRKQEMVEISTVDVSCRHLDAIAPQNSFAGAPRTGWVLTWLRAVSAWDEGWRNPLAAACGAIAILVVVIALIWTGWTLFGRGVG